MTLTIHVTVEQEAALTAKAKALGSSAEDYALHFRLRTISENLHGAHEFFAG